MLDKLFDPIAKHLGVQTFNLELGTGFAVFLIAIIVGGIYIVRRNGRIDSE